jgi:hypothetical protein
VGKGQAAGLRYGVVRERSQFGEGRGSVRTVEESFKGFMFGCFGFAAGAEEFGIGAMPGALEGEDLAPARGRGVWRPGFR